MKKLLTFLAAFCGFASVASAQYTAGDVAIIGVNVDSTDTFSWVTLVDLSPGTIVSFTDKGYQESNFRSSEGILNYAVGTSGVSAGSVLTYVGANPVGYSSSFGSFALPTGGDSIFAYIEGGQNVASYSSSEDTLLFAMNLDEDGWVPYGASSSNNSGLPNELSSASLSFGSSELGDQQFAYYKGTITGTASDLLSSITNPTNWVVSSDKGSSYSPSFTNFTITAAANNIPEPSTYALIFGGLAALGFIYRRRKQAIGMESSEE